MNNPVLARFTSRRLLATIVLVAVGSLSAACQSGVLGEPGALDDGKPFVAVAVRADAATLSSRAAVVGSIDDDSFYIAINKKELGNRFFLSAFLKQFFPGGAANFAASSLGSRVVSFRVQNGKLYVFDASDNFASSDAFSPELLIEAYPIVTDLAEFNDRPGASNFILFDPAAGLNRFNVLSDFLALVSATHFQIDLTFVERFRATPDGAMWEQVFSGNDLEGFVGDGSLEPNVFKGSGTISLALRRYSEGAGYTPTPLPDRELFFRSDAHIVPNSGFIDQTAIKWNIHAGMKPIKWLIAPEVARAAELFPQYDTVKAIKAGIENWNEVFGFKAFEAAVAKAGESFADDDKNFIIFDADPSFGAAFAQWRTNPNTGEIRGATVYFNAIWLYAGDQEFSDDELPAAAARPVVTLPAQRPRTTFQWGGLKAATLCFLDARDVFERGAGGPNLLDAGAAGPRSKKDKVEAFITHVVLHEVGHTLGLRHNFAGSLDNQSSTMEYIDDLAAVAASRDHPGPYDVAAVKFLYGLSPDEPTGKFCTDEDTIANPNCARFDFGAQPLVDDFGQSYAFFLNRFLSGSSSAGTLGGLNFNLNAVAGWLRRGTRDEARVALDILGFGLFNVDPQKASDPAYLARVDVATRNVWTRLFLDGPGLRGTFTNDPPPDATVTPIMLELLGSQLVNNDGVRGFSTRRAAVDVLKHLQTSQALSILANAETLIQANLGSLTGDALVQTNDLLKRIANALDPYFIAP